MVKTAEPYRAMNKPTNKKPTGMVNLGSSIISLEDQQAVKGFLSNTRSESTKQAYSSDWEIFFRWCEDRDYPALPSTDNVIAAFISDQVKNGCCKTGKYQVVALNKEGQEKKIMKRKTTCGCAPTTIRRRLAAIQLAHEAANHDTPTQTILVKETMRGIERTLKHKPNEKDPLSEKNIIDMMAHCDTTTLTGLRDRALLILGFSGAFRRSEVVNIKIADLKYKKHDDGSLVGLYIELPDGSKTNQSGDKEGVAIIPAKSHCPISILEEYIHEAGIYEGAVFRRIFKTGKLGENAISGRGYVDLLKRYALKIGLDSRKISGHSQRSGFITQGINKDKNVYRLMLISRHKSIKSFEKYIRLKDQFKDHAAEGLFNED